VLWLQAETNVTTPSDVFFQSLSATIAASHAEAGWDFPWFVAQVSYCNPQKSSFATTRDAQKRLWTEGIALEGPDTDTLTGDFRAGIHFNSKGLKAHGELWAAKVSAYLDRILAE